MEESAVRTDTKPARQNTGRAFNRSIKSWPAWVLMAVAVLALLVVGSTRSAGPQTQADRVDALTRRIACPVCDGESVFESQNNASRSIRNEVDVLVRENELSDDEILARINRTYDGELLLVPRSSGLDALVWVLPAAGFVIGVAGLVVAFRRWKLDAAAISDPTSDDRALVEAALILDDVESDREPE
jgi:cytochrome c-type biogenesis protein CcmH